MNLEISFIFGLIFNNLQVDGHQGTAISKYRLIPGDLSPSNNFYYTNTRGKIDCSKLCSFDENCKYFRYNPENKICRLYAQQFLKTTPDSMLFQVYVTGKCCYELVEEMSWHDAKTYCENKGGSLVNIKTEEKQREITALLQNSAPASNAHHWIGGIGKSKFYWTDGSAVSSGFENWGIDLDFNIFSDECMYLHGYLNYQWYNTQCSNFYRSICEYVLTT